MKTASKPTPTSTKAGEWLSWICDSTSTEQLRRRYNAWAKDYDAQVCDSWHAVPEAAAKLLARHCQTRDVPLLDAGAGTGLVGVALASHGFVNMTALDLSEGMLQEAMAKRVYNGFVRGDLEDPHVLPHGYAAVVSVGVFATGHGGPSALRNLARFVEPGGLLLLTARGVYRKVLLPELRSMPFESIERMTLPVYDGELIELELMRRRPT